MAVLQEKLNALHGKDFIKENILHVKYSCPPKAKRQYVDTRNGDTHNLESSGLYPTYIHKKNYGKAPKFVTRKIKVEEDVETEMNKYDLVEDKDLKMSSSRYVDQEERKILLDGLKQKWDENMTLFQRLPLLIDTPPKVQRKAKLERELQQLERDIGIIEQHLHIFVYDNDNAKY